MKKFKVVGIFIFILSLGVFFITSFNVKGAEEGKPQRGALRCPQNDLSKGVRCEEITKNGEVVEVRIIYGGLSNPGDIQIIKKVTKTDVLGHYGVQFEVRGKDIEQPAVPGPVYIILIVDTSKTIQDSMSLVKGAGNNFYEKLKTEGGENYHLAIMQFAQSNEIRKKFEQEEWTWKNYSSLGKTSHVEISLKEAKKMFDSVPEVDAKKYIVLLGDGQYWSSADTAPFKSVLKDRDALANNGVEIYTIRFDGSLIKRDANGKIKSSSDYGYYCQDVSDMLQLATNIQSAYATEIKNRCKGEGTKHNTIARYDDVVEYINKLATVDDFETHYKEVIKAEDYEDMFSTVADNIITSNKTSAGVVSELKDNVGNDFFLSNENGRNKKFNIGKITESGITTDMFYVDIDSSAPPTEPDGGGWYDTNNGFSLTYTDSSGTEHTITVNDNPQAYWISNSTEFRSCYDEVQHFDDRAVVEGSDYFSKICEEGYTDENDTSKVFDGFKVAINVNNQTIKGDEIKNFSILQGLGFPIRIDMSTHMRCVYEFKADEYNSHQNSVRTQMANIESEINRLNSQDDNAIRSQISALNSQIAGINSQISQIDEQIQSSTDATAEEIAALNAQRSALSSQISSINSEISSLENKINQKTIDLKNYLIQYNNLSDQILDLNEQLAGFNLLLNQEDLERYKERFIKQSATLNIDYEGDFPSAGAVFVTEEDDPQIVTKIECPKSEEKYGVVDGQNILIHKACYVDFSKTMKLPETCLDMKTAKEEECTGSNTQIEGGNKYYTKNTEKDDVMYGGQVIVNIPNAGYRQLLDYTLDKTEDGEKACTFTPLKRGDFAFRQIDLDDPFLTQYNRGVGINFKNNNFDFTGIIHSDTWVNSGTSQYDYFMSKTNIRAIKDDTAEESVSSYLGRECYFTSSKLYQCSFPRNKSETGDNGDRWFFKYNVE